MTRIYTLQEPAPGCFVLMVSIWNCNQNYGYIEVMFTKSDVHNIAYHQRFAGGSLMPTAIVSEFHLVLNKVARLRAGEKVEDLNKPSPDSILRFDDDLPE